MKERITLAGNIIVDNVKTVAAWPEKGMLVPILSMERAPGGAVSNSGVDLKQLDQSVEVAALGKVGNDDAGEFVTGFLKGRGLDVSGVKRVYGTPTSFTDVMTVAGTGERTFFNMHGADSDLAPEDVDPSTLGCSIFHLGYLLLLDKLDAEDEEYGTKAARLLANVRAAGIKTSVDIVSEQSDRFARVVRPALKHCDYAVINEVEGARATGISATDENGRVSASNLRRICEALFELGIGEQVVIHCPDLSVSLDKTGNFTALPSLDLPKGWIKGAVGAGDAFCAGMLYSFLKGMDAEEGMRLASCMAAMNLAALDSVSGAASFADTMALDSRFPRKAIG